jgi:hypothetical protein
MRFSNRFTVLAGQWMVAFCVAVWGVPATNVHAQGDQGGQRSFDSPDDAVKALQAATEASDKAALLQIFGPDFKELMTGDETQDANNAKKFAAALASGGKAVKDGEDKVTIEIGTNNWPMPIPLVKSGGQWRFDTAAGKEEIINRHIGRDELHAIGVCQAYVPAQQQFAKLNPDASGGATYAVRFKSSPSKRDGLFWTTTDNEPASPFGPLVAEAHIEGYEDLRASRWHPFHGYFFKILTRQGPDAPGGARNYMSHGKLTGGFALVAYPEEWDKSGIMTFIVNQDGKVYQRNLGEDTLRIARAMKAYNPNADWVLARDQGVAGAAAEK